MTNQNPIAAAVEPLKAEAMQAAGDFARERIADLYAKLEAAGWNLDAVAPRPRSMGRANRAQYQAQAAFVSFAEYVTEGTQVSRRPNEPRIVCASQKRADAYVQNAVETAGLQFQAYVAKLVLKVGACDAAALLDNSKQVWGYSVLVVTKGEAKEHWKTQRIVNISKLGTVFNQWPTRQLK